jgi:signal transduction protein with GAF and PtsI domain
MPTDRTDGPAQHQDLKAQLEAQAQQIASLEARLAALQSLQRFDSLLAKARVIARLTEPVESSHLLEMIVRTAVHVISASYGTLFLVHEDRQDLSVEVATAPDAEQFRTRRVTMGHGIAGLVAMTGQPLAVADAVADSRHASDIAEQTGYAPQSLLCVPLIDDERVIGVLELLDKQGGPHFTTADMEGLGLFANQAAIAIELSRSHRDLTRLMMQALAQMGCEVSPDLQEALRAAASQQVTGEACRHALELAELISYITSRGERASRACMTLLKGFADSLKGQEAAMGGWNTG